MPEPMQVGSTQTPTTSVARPLQEGSLFHHHHVGLLDGREVGHEAFEDAAVAVGAERALFAHPFLGAAGAADPVSELEVTVIRKRGGDGARPGGHDHHAHATNVWTQLR